MLSFFDLIAEKNRVWKRILFHLSPIAMRLSRYAGATPGTGCCGDFRADIYRTGSCPHFELKFVSLRTYLPRKEVIQPHLPVRLPCYDFTPLTLHTFDASVPCGFGRRLRAVCTRPGNAFTAAC